MKTKRVARSRKSARRSASRSPDEGGRDIIATLFGTSRRRFLARVAGRMPLLHDGPARRVRPIFGEAAVLRMGQLRKLIPNFSGSIYRLDFDSAGLEAFRRLRGTAKRGITRRRASIHFLHQYQRHFATVKSAVDELCLALGYSKRGANCQGILESDGAFVPRHCDGTDVLIVQLFGTRKWRLEPNSNPPKGLRARVGLPKKMRAGWSAEFAPNAPVVALRAGSALYIPRGWWHEIRAKGNSFALTFTIFPRRPAPRRH
jgi:JmjC domain